MFWGKYSMILQTPIHHFNEDNQRAKDILAHAAALPAGAVKNDILRASWMMSVGSLDAYFCDAYGDFLVAQAKNERSPFTFVDMSVKEPWTQKIWKEKCREQIQECDGMIVLLSKNTWHSSGSRWEITCSKEEKVPVVGM